MGVDQARQQGYRTERPERAEGVGVRTVAFADGDDPIALYGHPPVLHRRPVDRHDPGRAKPRHATGEAGP
jgi:hypothetical protein